MTDTPVPLADRIRNAPHDATVTIRPWETNPANALLGQYNRGDVGLLILPDSPAADPQTGVELAERVKDAIRPDPGETLFPWKLPVENLASDPEEYRRLAQRIIDALRGERHGEDQP